MQTWDHETATIHNRENAKAVQRAVDQITTDLPDTEVTEATLHSRIVPLPNKNLRIKGPRWYVKATVHNLNNGSKVQALYRVWHDQGELKAAQVKTDS